MTATSAPRTRPAPTPTSETGQNVVVLQGRVSGEPFETELPSGDSVVALRLVVPRGAKERKPPYVDTIDCSAWSARLRRSALSWREGDVVLVEGMLRRRFWRGNQGAQSRYEVEISRARRVERIKP